MKTSRIRQTVLVLSLMLALWIGLGLLRTDRAQAGSEPLAPQSSWATTMAPSAPSTFAKRYGNSGANSIVATPDGGYILAGNGAVSDGSYPAWVSKLDSAGNILWQKAYKGGSSLNSIAPTSDGGYIAAGNTFSFGAGDSDAWVVKLDSVGNILWQKAIGGVDSDGAISVAPTLDGGYVVLGFTEVIAQGMSDSWIVKLDSAGSILWQKKYGGRNVNPALRQIIPTSDGGYVLAGMTPSQGAPNDGWVLKLDANGNIVWQRSYGGSNFDAFASIALTGDGGYIAAGNTVSFGAGSSDAWVVKLDGSGNLSWQKTYGGTDLDQIDAIASVSGGSVAVGFTQSFGAGGLDAWIVRLDSAGAVLWQKTFGGGNRDQALAIVPTSDGGSAIAGSTDSFGSQDAFVFKTDANGNVPLPCSIVLASSASAATSTATTAAFAAAAVNAALVINSTSATVTNPLAQVTTLCPTVNVTYARDDFSRTVVNGWGGGTRRRQLCPARDSGRL